jgi:hypothetical protein
MIHFWLLSIVRYSKEYNVSETGSLSVLVKRWVAPTLLSPLEKPTSITGPTEWVPANTSPEEYRKIRSQNSVIRSVSNHRQKSLESKLLTAERVEKAQKK